MKRILYLFILIVAMTSCSHDKTTTEPTQVEVDTIPMMVMQIQNCSRLYTSEVHVRKIITHNDEHKLSGKILGKSIDMTLPLGDRKIAIPMEAMLKAYIDFSKFSEDNIIRRGDKIEIVLPDPKVILTSVTIDRDEVKSYVSLTRSNFSDEELTSFERQGRQAIINDIPQINILGHARESAANTIIPMIAQLGYKEENITVTFRKEFTLKDISNLIINGNKENGSAE